MRELLEFAAREDVRRAVTRAIEFREVHAVLAEPDQARLASWRIYLQGGRGDPSYLWLLAHELGRLQYLGDPSGRTIGAFFEGGYDEPPPQDWEPPFWDKYAEEYGFERDAPAVSLRIHLRPRTATPSLLDALRNNVGDTPFPVRFRVHPLPRFVLGPRSASSPLEGGLEIGTRGSGPGTMGGVIDQGGARYGVTCAHVAQQGADISQPAATKAARSIGSITHRSSLEATQSGQVCNPYRDDGNSQDIDVALIELRGDEPTALRVLDIGPISRVTNRMDIGTGQTVEFAGAQSGHKLVRLGAVGMTTTIADQARIEYCFKEVIYIQPTISILGRSACPVVGGDSGAWLVDQYDGGVGWCGMVIGSDITGMAVACFSEPVGDWIRQSVGAFSIGGDPL